MNQQPSIFLWNNCAPDLRNSSSESILCREMQSYGFTIQGMVLECPANFVPVEMRQTGMRGAWNGTRKEAYTGADREAAAAG